MYIYRITNLVNGKVYIGQCASDVTERMQRHKLELNTHRHVNKHLQSAWNKYGQENFTFKVIDQFNNSMTLSELEIKWIQYFNANDDKYGYNKTTGGESGRLSKDADLKRAESVKTYYKNNPEALRTGDKNPMFGKRQTVDTCLEISKKLKGKIAHNRKQVRCLNNNVVYPSIRHAAMGLNLRREEVRDVCNGRRKHAKGYVFNIVTESK